MHHSGLTTNTGKKITLEFGGGPKCVSFSEWNLF